MTEILILIQPVIQIPQIFKNTPDLFQNTPDFFIVFLLPKSKKINIYISLSYIK